VKKINFLGGGIPTKKVRLGGMCDICFLQKSTLAMCSVNMNCLGVLAEKGQRLNNCEKKIVLGATYRGWGGAGEKGLWDIFLTDINPDYEVGEYELSR